MNDINTVYSETMLELHNTLRKILKEYRRVYYEAGAKDKGDLPFFNEETAGQIVQLFIELLPEEQSIDQIADTFPSFVGANKEGFNQAIKDIKEMWGAE